MKNDKNLLNLFKENEASLQDRINLGIEQNRKGYFSVSVVDENNNPVPSVKIKAIQKKHAFKFGANLSMLGALSNEEENKAYEDSFCKLFNAATVLFNWDSLEPSEGNLRFPKNSPEIPGRPPIDACMDFCAEKGLEPRLHSLAGEGAYPKWLYGKSSDEIKKALSKRIEKIAKDYSASIPSIETVSGMFGYDNNIGFYNDDDYVSWCINEAEKNMPCNKLVLNENTRVWYDGFAFNRDCFYMQIEQLLRKNIRIDALGMDFKTLLTAREEYVDSMRIHMWCGFWPKELEDRRQTHNPKYIYKILDKYADFHLPIQLSAVSVPSFSNDECDEEIQAELIKYLYSIWFSHRSVEQIMYCDLIDNTVCNFPENIASSRESTSFCGLLRKDLSKKPAYDVLDDLINNKWHTETDIVTDENGNAVFKGFYGDYDFVLNDGSGKILGTASYSRDINPLTKFVL